MVAPPSPPARGTPGSIPLGVDFDGDGDQDDHDEDAGHHTQGSQHHRVQLHLVTLLVANKRSDHLIQCVHFKYTADLSCSVTGTVLTN